MTSIRLGGLTTAPSQVWGGVRLVPLLRARPVVDLRLHRKLYGGGIGVVETKPREEYVSYIPHGFVATWSDDETPAASYGTHLGDGPPPSMALRFHRKLARREDRNRLRFMPLHLALDGYLSLHFGGPTILWDEWSRQAIRNGLSPRVEEAYAGAEIGGLADAMRVFEVHPGQCGVLVYVADALASAFVVPHPEDYRALHTTLLGDLYGDLIHHYGNFTAEVPDFRARIEDASIASFADLRRAAGEQERAWAAFHDGTMAAGLLADDYRAEEVYRLGRFTLSRLLPTFKLRRDNHLAETITDEHGRVLYLKTFRLSELQVRRGHLLDTLAAADWHLASAAAALGLDEPRLAMRLESAGFGALLRRDVLDGFRKRAREG